MSSTMIVTLLNPWKRGAPYGERPQAVTICYCITGKLTMDLERLGGLEEVPFVPILIVVATSPHTISHDVIIVWCHIIHIEDRINS